MGLVLLLVSASALYFGRGFFQGLLGKGDCATGCAKCGDGGCAAQKITQLAEDWKRKQTPLS